jgi:hypothetical protein
MLDSFSGQKSSLNCLQPCRKVPGVAWETIRKVHPHRSHRFVEPTSLPPDVDLSSASQVTPACSCASCVVSALQGL